MDAPSYRPQIIVALIGMAGVLGAALLSNWDKITGSRAAAPAVGANAQGGPAPAAANVDQLADSQRNAYSAAAGALEDVAAKISAASLPDISGKWRSADGYGFQVTQNGRGYSFQEYAPNGGWVGSGEGQLTERHLKHSFRAPDLDVTAGECSADVAPDGQSISGNCHDNAGGSSWGFRIDR